MFLKFSISLAIAGVGALSVRLGKQEFKHTGAVSLTAGQSVGF